jgi:hypothetical protein
LAIALVHGEEPGEDSLAVDERRANERGDEVLVLFPEGAELSYAQVLFVRHQPVYLGSPSGDAVLAFWRTGSRRRSPQACR